MRMLEPATTLAILAVIVYLIGCVVTSIKLELEAHEWGFLVALGAFCFVPLYALTEWKRCSLGLGVCLVGLAMYGISFLI